MEWTPPHRHDLAALLQGRGKKGPPARDFPAVLRNLCALLRLTRTGEGFLRLALCHGMMAGEDPRLSPSESVFFPRANLLLLGAQTQTGRETQKGLSRHLAGFTGGLRRAWHHYLGHAVHNLMPRDYIRMARIAEADAQCAVLLAARELRDLGRGFFWRDLFTGDCGDMALVYADRIEREPQSQFDGRALRAAFDQWFARPARVAQCDAAALETCDTLLATGMTQPPRPFRQQDAQMLGFLPGGTQYLAGCGFARADLHTPPPLHALAREARRHAAAFAKNAFDK